MVIKGSVQIRPRYGEVDQMGYVYHANYLSYCHEARTELMRGMGIHDSYLEENNLMMPVISFEIKYKKPAHYDEIITINTVISEIPDTRFKFEYKILNQENELIAIAKSTVVFIKSDSRTPIRVPEFIKDALKKGINP